MASEKSNTPRSKAFKVLLNICQNFDEEHKHFLQFLVTRRSIEVSMIGKIFLQICLKTSEDNKNKLKELKTFDADENRQIMNSLRDEINPKLSTLGLHIAQRADEYSRRNEYWVLISELHFSTGLVQSATLQKEEMAMFHHWLRLMFTEYRTENMSDSEEDATGERDDNNEKTTGELETTKALHYAKKKGWTFQRAQKLLDKLEQQKWISVVKSDEEEGGHRFRREFGRSDSIIRLMPCVAAELEPLFSEMHAPQCIICKHPIIVSRLAFTCEECEESYHASCILREMEFPADCRGEECNAQLGEEILENFNFDADTHCIRPRRTRRTSNLDNTAVSTSLSNTSTTRA